MLILEIKIHVIIMIKYFHTQSLHQKLTYNYGQMANRRYLQLLIHYLNNTSPIINNQYDNKLIDSITKSHTHYMSI